MADVSSWFAEQTDEEDEAILHPRRPLQQEEELDITPMIDVTFLLLIFFLVCSIPDAQTSVELPTAEYGTGVVAKRAVIITVADVEGTGKVEVYLADGKEGEPLPDDDAIQAAAIQQAVEAGQLEGKNDVLIKAARTVRHRDVSRIASAATQVENVTLNYAVLESD
ncbi:MAG: biopolymer transporter ExbD [Pirellulales bacterium]|nr:biopolymer transporter ExbD [Planctomycetales bacterium]